MGLFGKSKEPLAGVDISSTSIKVLELSRLGKNSKNYKVESYAIEPLPSSCVVEKNIVDVEAVGEAMKRVVKRAKIKADFAAVAVAGSSVITKTIQMPRGLSDDEMEAAITLEADQYIPYPMDEVNLDFEVTGTSDKDDDEVDVLLAASKSDTVESRIAVLEMGGLKGKVVDIESFALENAFAVLAENDPEIDSEDVIALVDIGATATTFNVLQGAQILHTREQAFGGDQLTEQIQHRYGLSYEEATLAKRQGTLPDDYQTDLLEPFKDAMVQEINRAIQFYYASSTTGTISHTIVAGGCASIPGVVDLIREKVGGHVTLANPFSGMSVSAKVSKKSLASDAPSLIIACGLALRSFE